MCSQGAEPRKQQLALETKERYDLVDQDVKELARLRNKIEYRCLHPRDEETRSLCVGKDMDLNDKLQAARRQRTKLREKYEAYKVYL